MFSKAAKILVLSLCLIRPSIAGAQTVSKIQITTGSTTITLMAMPKSVLLGTVCDQRRKLENILASAAQNGQLSQQQHDDLKSELDRVAQEEAAINSEPSKTANSKVMGLARSLDDVVLKMNSIMGRPVALPLVEGSHFAVKSGDWIDIDDVAMRRWDLEGRISKLLAEGKITKEQAVQVRNKLDVVAERESEMRADGDLDFKESRTLYEQFDSVARQIESLSKRRK